MGGLDQIIAKLAISDIVQFTFTNILYESRYSPTKLSESNFP